MEKGIFKPNRVAKWLRVITELLDQSLKLKFDPYRVDLSWPKVDFGWPRVWLQLTLRVSQDNPKGY